MDAPLNPDNVRLALDEFDRAFRRPMDGFHRALDGLTTEGASPAPADAAEAMAYLCEDARALPERFRDHLMAVHDGRTPEPAPMRLSDLLAEVDRRIAPEALARSQRFLCSVDDDAEVRADLALCAEVLSQLASNAVLYAPPGASVKVAAESRGTVWRMSVRDDGPGVPPRLRERLFEPFERLSRDIQAQVPGAGLGLTLCRALVGRMGGTITLDGPPEGGTLVTVEMPAT